jgi:hypothetical protein
MALFSFGRRIDLNQKTRSSSSSLIAASSSRMHLIRCIDQAMLLVCGVCGILFQQSM